jgi:hypothetical protein
MLHARTADVVLFFVRVLQVEVLLVLGRQRGKHTGRRSLARSLLLDRRLGPLVATAE